MPVRVMTALLFVLALSGLAADMTVGCASQQYVYGVVEAKFSGNGDANSAVLQIASETYTVPQGFYQSVQVGDWVRFDGKTWTIVKSAGTTFDRSQDNKGDSTPNVPALPAITPPAH